MTTLSTHDTKRGEDLRARLAVLAELPEEWADAVRQLQRARADSQRGIRLSPLAVLRRHRADRADRVHAFAEKAMREAAQETSWAAPNEPFEQAVHGAVDAAYDRPEVRRLDRVPLSETPSATGGRTPCCRRSVQLTMPGVPDVYQGSERFEGSLVDPDNRRPVDFVQLAAALDVLERAGSGPPFDTPSAKLWVTRHALHARRDRPELFTTYRPLVLEGALHEHLLAFDRGGAITLATRLPVGLQRLGGWGDETVALPRRHLSRRVHRRTLRGGGRPRATLRSLPGGAPARGDS